MRAAEPFGADAELLQHLRQFVGGVLAVANQLFEIVRRDPQILRDAIEIGAVELPDLVQLAAMLQPACKGLDEVLDNGIRPGCGAHAKLHSNGGIGARLGTMVQVRVALDQIAMREPGSAAPLPLAGEVGAPLSPTPSRKRERERTSCAAVSRTAPPPTHTGCPGSVSRRRGPLA